MSTLNPYIHVEKKLTRELSLDFDDVVVDVSIDNVQMKKIHNLTVDFDNAGFDAVYTKNAVLQNYAVNNVTLVNGTVKNEKYMNTVRFQLPLSVEGKSRNFCIRVEKPTNCNYKFVECDGVSKVDVQSNVDLSYRFDDYIRNPQSISTYIFDCYELHQNPTKLFVGSQNQLSSISTRPIRHSKLEDEDN